VAGALTLVLSTAGCTATHDAAAGRGTTLPTPVTTPSTAAQTDVTTPATAIPTSSAVSTSPSATPTTATGTPLPADNCPTSQLTVRVIIGSGAQQQEFAEVGFTNAGSAECSLTGYPSVTLLRGSTQLGQPATPDQTKPAGTVHLQPGDTAQALLTDFSSCNAPLSDTVRVSPPSSALTVDRPGVLRGCKVSVQPVTKS
jgi:hypothetical protein